MTKPLKYVLVDDLPKEKITHTETHILEDGDERYGYNQYRTEAISKCRELDVDKLAKFLEDNDKGMICDEILDNKALAEAIIQHIQEGEVVK